MTKEHKLQGHLTFQGLEIAVENKKGSVRSGVDKSGKPWRTEMKAPYGYVVGTEGADGDEVDVYVGPVADAENAYVVHQRKEDGKTYDEDKVMLGFSSEEDARKMYLAHYNSPKFLGPVSTIPMPRFKKLMGEKKIHTKLAQVQRLAFADELGKIFRARS